MKLLSQFTKSTVKILFTDIDDTMTTEGKLEADSYQALWHLHENDIQVIPVTGRPAGWCEMIARFWPISGVIGENGGFYFCYLKDQKKMKRYFAVDEKQRREDKLKLKKIENQILNEVEGSALSSDQFCRLCDLAIDVCEDIPALSQDSIKRILEIFSENGAQAKLSSIHINGWLGQYDKLSTCREYCRRELGKDLPLIQDHVAFVGDSPNDEPMFKYFLNSFAVANIRKFAPKMNHLPAFVTPSEAGRGFCELAESLCPSMKISNKN